MIFSEPPISESANPPNLAWHYADISTVGLVYVGPTCYLLQGEEHGTLVDDTDTIVGHIYWPTDGAIHIKGPGFDYDFTFTTLDVDHNGFINGTDKDQWDWWWWYGYPMADYDGNSFVNGDDYDLFHEDWLKGTT